MDSVCLFGRLLLVEIFLEMDHPFHVSFCHYRLWVMMGYWLPLFHYLQPLFLQIFYKFLQEKGVRFHYYRREGEVLNFPSQSCHFHTKLWVCWKKLCLLFTNFREIRLQELYLQIVLCTYQHTYNGHQIPLGITLIILMIHLIHTSIDNWHSKFFANEDNLISSKDAIKKVTCRTPSQHKY